MEENQEEEKKKSKLSAMIGQSQRIDNSSQYTVHYSENNWQTIEEVNLILDENATIKELMDAAVKKFKTEHFYDDIDKKQLIVKIFKKKKKIPNDEYPVCSLTTKVNGFGKSHFCLVDIKEEKNEENEVEQEGDTVEPEIELKKTKAPNEEIKINQGVQKVDETKNSNKGENHNNINNKNSSPDNNNTVNTPTNNVKGNKQSCLPCILI